MPQLFITKAKPNPVGKDLFGSLVPSQQLAGEWVEFLNTSVSSISLSRIVLQHIAYTYRNPSGEWEIACDFIGRSITLGSGESIRIHSGGEVDLSQLLPVDRDGATYHVFTGKGYIWNNDHADAVRLVIYQDGYFVQIDRADYSAYPHEGQILIRQAGSLI